RRWRRGSSLLTAIMQQRWSAPSPRRGEGWGEGGRVYREGGNPLAPTLSPNGEREPTELAVGICIQSKHAYHLTHISHFAGMIGSSTNGCMFAAKCSVLRPPKMSGGRSCGLLCVNGPTPFIG